MRPVSGDPAYWPNERTGVAGWRTVVDRAVLGETPRFGLRDGGYAVWAYSVLIGEGSGCDCVCNLSVNPSCSASSESTDGGVNNGGDGFPVRTAVTPTKHSARNNRLFIVSFPCLE